MSAPSRTQILTINSGSSSLKASLIGEAGRRDFRYGNIGKDGPKDHEEALDALLHALGGVRPRAVGHRITHGGDVPDAARLIDPAERDRLQALVPLAPLHLPSNLLGVDRCAGLGAPQFACYDTAFHHTLPEAARRLPLPGYLQMRRYGFHGISYAHVARVLPDLLGPRAEGRVVVAHLGHGASLCLLNQRRSVDTTMGYTPVGGIPMGTRPGDLDPGVMAALARRYSPDDLTRLIYREMGLLALSDGLSADMGELTASDDARASFAVAYFCRQVRGAIGALAAKAGGLDALVFTGGIGEHSAAVRAAVCDPLDHLGLRLDTTGNASNAGQLHAAGSKPVLIVPADEEAMIAEYVRKALARGEALS